MILESLESIVKALNGANSRYMVAGGLAVNAHGYIRATHDVDLVIQLGSDNLQRSLSALETLGYTPLPPVPLMDFVDADKRATWIQEKGLTVFPLVSDQHPQAPIDVFVDEPFDFNLEYERALLDDLLPSAGLPVRFVSLDTLISMKKAVGRHRDMDDIEHLETIKHLSAVDSTKNPS